MFSLRKRTNFSWVRKCSPTLDDILFSRFERPSTHSFSVFHYRLPFNFFSPADGAEVQMLAAAAAGNGGAGGAGGGGGVGGRGARSSRGRSVGASGVGKKTATSTGRGRPPGRTTTAASTSSTTGATSDHSGGSSSSDMLLRSWTRHSVAEYQWKKGVVRPPHATAVPAVLSPAGGAAGGGEGGGGGGGGGGSSEKMETSVANDASTAAAATASSSSSNAAVTKVEAAPAAAPPPPPTSSSTTPKNAALFRRGDVTLVPNEGTSLLVLPVDVLLFHADYLQPGRVPILMQFNLMLERIWSDVASKEFSQPFLQPLLSSLSSEERAEWEVLLQGSIPMDLSCIEGNIRAMKYRSIKDFVNDVQQIER